MGISVGRQHMVKAMEWEKGLENSWLLWKKYVTNTQEICEKMVHITKTNVKNKGKQLDVANILSCINHQICILYLHYTVPTFIPQLPNILVCISESTFLVS